MTYFTRTLDLFAPVRSVRVREAGGIPLSSGTRVLLTARQAALLHRPRDDYKRINRANTAPLFGQTPAVTVCDR